MFEIEIRKERITSKYYHFSLLVGDSSVDVVSAEWAVPFHFHPFLQTFFVEYMFTRKFWDFCIYFNK